MQLQEGKPIPVAPLECDEAIPDCEESTSAQAQGIFPFQGHHITCFMNGFWDACHLGGAKLPKEHLPDRGASNNRLPGNLMIDRVERI